MRQLEAFTSLWEDNSAYACGNGNNRRVQPLNDRSVYTNSGLSFSSTGLNLLSVPSEAAYAGKEAAAASADALLPFGAVDQMKSLSHGRP